MAYTLNDYVNLITKYKDSDPGLAFAIFNGLSGMGGNGVVDPGAVDIALRNAWGDSEARNWIGTTDNIYGSAMFDPESGKYGYYQNGQIKSGSLEGWTPANYDKTLEWSGPVNYQPVTTFPGAGDGRPGTGGGNGTIPQPVQGQNPRTTTPVSTTPVTTNPGVTDPIGTAPVGGGTTPVQGVTSTPLGSTGAGGTTLPAASAAYWTRPTVTAPEVDPGNPMDFFDDAGYQFRLQQGQDGIQNTAAAKGSLLSGATLKSLTNYASDLASQEYGKAYDRYTNTRDYNRNVYTNNRDFDQAAAADERNYNNENRKWDTSFNENQRRDVRDFDFMFGKDARDYTTDLDKWNAMFKRNADVEDRNYSTDLEKWNKTFGYTVDSGDRAFNADILKTLLSSGLSATGGDANLAATLSAIFGNNTMTGATAGASGTVGQANNLQNLLNLLFASSFAKP